MKPNPFASLLHSRKFWLLFLDVVVALVTLFVTNHLKPELVTELLAVIGIIQPLWIMVIKGITDEDTARINATDSAAWMEKVKEESKAAAFPDDDPARG